MNTETAKDALVVAAATCGLAQGQESKKEAFLSLRKTQQKAVDMLVRWIPRHTVPPPP